MEPVASDTCPSMECLLFADSRLYGQVQFVGSILRLFRETIPKLWKNSATKLAATFIPYYSRLIGFCSDAYIVKKSNRLDHLE